MKIGKTQKVTTSPKRQIGKAVKRVGKPTPIYIPKKVEEEKVSV